MFAWPLRLLRRFVAADDPWFVWLEIDGRPWGKQRVHLESVGQNRLANPKTIQFPRWNGDDHVPYRLRLEFYGMMQDIRLDDPPPLLHGTRFEMIVGGMMVNVISDDYSTEEQ